MGFSLIEFVDQSSLIVFFKEGPLEAPLQENNYVSGMPASTRAFSHDSCSSPGCAVLTRLHNNHQHYILIQKSSKQSAFWVSRGSTLLPGCPDVEASNENAEGEKLLPFFHSVSV